MRLKKERWLVPHKVGKKWKWGNIERSSREELRKTIYGIWMKNGSKGSFSKFWKTGKVDEAEDVVDELDKLRSRMVFKKVQRNELVLLLDEIETYNESKRFKRERFEKYLGSGKMIDREDKSMYYGLFSLDGHCLALSYLNKTPANCVLVAEISCIVPGYGRLLLQDIINRSSAMWLAADPRAEDTLLDYYRTFGLEEVVLDHSKWVDGREEHFFLKASGKSRDKILLMLVDVGKLPSS